MNFKTSNVEHYTSPRELNVDEILKAYGTSLADMKQAIKDTAFVLRGSFPITKDLSKQLEDLLERLFTKGGAMLYRCGYSKTMGETSDVAVGRKGHPKKIFIEIEFRPNEHKDILKFLIGYKQQILELGILLVAINRESIAKHYYTMPEYEKCVQIIKELQSDCPILVIGFDGQMISNEGIET